MRLHLLNRMVIKMKNWQILCLGLFALSIIICRKTSIISILIDQIKIYKNDRNNKYYWVDIITFIIIPIVISIIVALNFPILKIINNAETIITIFSLIATLPLSFLALLIDRIMKNKKAEEVAKETFVSITVDIIYSITIIGLVIVGALISLNEVFGKIIVGLIAFLTVKIVLNILMILKRVYNSY